MTFSGVEFGEGLRVTAARRHTAVKQLFNFCRFAASEKSGFFLAKLKSKSKMTNWKTILVLVLFTWSILLSAQNKPSIQITYTNTPIRVDGQLNEEVWNFADVADGFTQYFPSDTSLAESQTEVRLAYDDQYLYVGAKMYNKNPERNEYVTPSLRRDYRGEANDGITLILDPFQDNTNAFQFGVNPFGVQREGLIANGGGSGGDLSLSWDNRWYAEAVQYGDYWIAEMAIPFKTLRFKEGSDRWNINFYRIDSEDGERSSWTPIPQNYRIISLAYIGELIWDKPLRKPGANVAVIPYALARTSENYEEGGGPDSGFDFGGDAKIAVGPALNLDLTFNPDFSQVEVDQQVTNLDRFEIFFPERRQFFLENADLFSDFGDSRIRPFFSRRIGVARDESTGQNVQNPIYGGARLSGKLNDDWRVGLLSMQSARDIGINKPTTNYTVAAVQRKVFSRSNIGMIFVNKQPFEDRKLADTSSTLFEENRVLGLDYNLASRDDKWTGKFFYHQSFEEGQPDSAYAASARLSYNTLRWQWRTTAQAIGANYNPETGFARRVNYNRIASTVEHRWYPKGGIIQSHGPGFDFDIFGNEQYGLTDYDVNILYNINFRNTSRFSLRLRREYVYLFNSFEPTRTGGVELGADTDYGYNLIIARYNSDQRKRFVYELSTRSGGYFNGTRLNLEGSVGYRFQPYGSISLDFSVNRIRLPEPYNDADLFLIGPRFDITFTRKLFWTTFIQYNNQIENININSRLQWRFRPVSDLFIVYTDNYFPDTFNSKSRALVLKCTYWLNL